MFPVYVNHLMPGLKRDMLIKTLGTLAYDSNQSPHNRAIACCFACHGLEYFTRQELKAKMDNISEGTEVSLSFRKIPRIR